jgi:hypothetical protein
VVRIPAWARDFSLLHRFRTGYTANPASYSVHTEGSFSDGTAARKSIWCQAQEFVELHLHHSHAFMAYKGQLYFYLTFCGQKPRKQDASHHYNSHRLNNQQLKQEFLLKCEYIKINSTPKHTGSLVQRSIGYRGSGK